MRLARHGLARDDGIALVAAFGRGRLVTLILTATTVAASAAPSAAPAAPLAIAIGGDRVAFVLGVAVCFLFAVTSYPVVTAFISSAVPELAVLARRISVVARFQGFVRGTIDLRDLVFFASFIGFWLYLNTLFVKARQTD